MLAAYSIERLAGELALHYRTLAAGTALAPAGGAQVPVERRAARRMRSARVEGR